VRVVETDGGYYLLARDRAGRVHERIVPDAQSAGVLVASWAADDAPPPAAEPTPPPAAFAPDSTVIEIVGQLVVDAPGLAPMVDRIVPTAAAPSRHATRWLTLGGVYRVEQGGGGGVRADLDLFAVGQWTLGIAAAGSRSYSNFNFDFEGFGTLQTDDIRALATVARTTRRGAWDLRIGGGAGVVRTNAVGYTTGGTYTAKDASLAIEGSVLLSRRLGERTAFAIGPVVNYYSQNLDAVKIDDLGAMYVPLARRDLDLSLFGGLRLAL